MEYTFKQREREGKTEVFDPIRKKWLVMTPEERVRQQLILFLLNVKRIPASHLSVERAITVNGLTKRYDLVVFGQDMKPHMVIECKAPHVERELIGDLVNGYLYDFEKDDIITFTAEGVQTIKPGNLLPAEDQDGYTQDVAYLWRIDEENDGWIFMQVPFFYDEVQEYVHILTLDENQFKFLCTFNDDEQGAKGTYTLTMNYVRCSSE